MPSQLNEERLIFLPQGSGTVGYPYGGQNEPHPLLHYIHKKQFEMKFKVRTIVFPEENKGGLFMILA